MKTQRLSGLCILRNFRTVLRRNPSDLLGSKHIEDFVRSCFIDRREFPTLDASMHFEKDVERRVDTYIANLGLTYRVNKRIFFFAHFEKLLAEAVASVPKR